MLAWSFVAKRCHGIDAKGATRWEISSGERDEQEQSCEGCQYRDTHGDNAKDEGSHSPANRERNRQTDAESDPRDGQSVPENEAEHVLRIRTEGKANAKFVRPLRNVFGQNSINADGRQQQS